MKVAVVNYAHNTSANPLRDHLADQLRQNSQVRDFGADVLVSWNRTSLSLKSFYDSHKDILDEPRGAGFWLWKPYLILHTLQSDIDFDVLVYLDSDVVLKSSIVPFAKIAEQNGVAGVRTTYKHSRYCKRDVAQAFPGANPVYDLYATVIAFDRDITTERFVTEWLLCCTNKHWIDDSPSYSGEMPFPDFVAPRNDQSIFTILYNIYGFPILEPSVLDFTTLYPLPSFQREEYGKFTDID